MSLNNFNGICYAERHGPLPSQGRRKETNFDSRAIGRRLRKRTIGPPLAAVRAHAASHYQPTLQAGRLPCRYEGVEARTAVVDLGDRARAELADLIDLQMSPLGLAAIAGLALERGHTVLDVGCGAGETVLQLADRVGPSGRVIGVDLAPRVLAVARQRTAHLPQVMLLQEDAAGLALPQRSVDRVFSRFGTMFFASPVAAFTNMRRMLKPGGQMAFVCWRSMQENELDAFCIEAAGLPITVDPSPFSFESAAAIEKVLTSTGFHQIEILAHDAQVSSGNAEATLKVVTRVGALGKALRENPALLSEAEPPVRAALVAREHDGVVYLGAATWIVTAAA